jgi:hypothetical protein
MATILEATSVERDDIDGTFPAPFLTILSSVSLEGSLPRTFVRVRDSAGNLLSGVSVEIKDSTDTVVQTVTTNTNGIAATLVDSGVSNPVSITFTKTGFPIYTLNLTFEDDTFLEVTMPGFSSLAAFETKIELDDDLGVRVTLDSDPEVSVQIDDLKIVVGG